MIAVDTNVLVYAHRRDSEFHPRAVDCIRSLAEGAALWAIPWPCVHEFLSIVTHPRIYDPPSSLEEATEQVDVWLESPRLVLLAEARDHWLRLRGHVIAGRAAGPLVHDARIAALCGSHGIAELWTLDRDFGRFAGARVVNPLRT